MRDYKEIFKQIEDQEKQTQHKNSKILLVDSLNTFLRSFAAIHHINPTGNHIGGLSGYLKSVGSVIRHIEPTRVILVFDGQGGSTNKRYLYPEYKANRHITKITNWDAFDNQEEESEAITQQIIRLIDYLKCLPVDLVAIDKIEADDVIGYLAKQFKEKVVILSTDQDYLQLVNENISIFSPVKKTIYYTDTVVKEFGVHPNNFLTHKVIVGDKGDNVPGVKGIALKTLIKLYPELKNEETVSLTDLIQESENKAGKYRDVYNYRHQLLINKQLMDLREPNIPEEDVMRLDYMVSNPNSNYDPQTFLKLCNEDQLGKSLLNPQIWLSETFAKLKDYQLEN